MVSCQWLEVVVIVIVVSAGSRLQELGKMSMPRVISCQWPELLVIVIVVAAGSRLQELGNMSMPQLRSRQSDTTTSEN